MLPIIILASEQETVNEYIHNLGIATQDTTTDLVTIHLEGKSISINQVREITGLSVQRNIRYTFIIHDFHAASFISQNALLKTLEDDALYHRFILLAEHSQSILPTIVSRCQLISLIDMSISDYQFVNIDMSIFDMLDRYSTIGNVDAAISLFDRTIIPFVRHNISKKSMTDVLRQALFVRSLLLRNNMNPQMAVDLMLMRILATMTE